MKEKFRLAHSPSDSTGAALGQPAAGMYPSGRSGFGRFWDGQAWTGLLVAGPDALAGRGRSHWWRHADFWVLIGGLLVGSGFVFLGSAANIVAVLAAGSVFVTGGPLVALVLVVRNRLHLTALPTRAATWIGVGAGLASVCLSVGLEFIFPAGVFAGFIEEGTKLLIPFILLLTGPRWCRNPRLGIWMVTVAGATFGILEGIEYVTAPIGDFRHASGLDRGLDMLFVTANRPWMELLHVLLTAGAAAVIWLAAHRRGHAFTWAGLGGFAIAAAIHSFNDAVVTPFGGLTGILSGFVLTVLVFFFWFRPRVRAAVPPDAVRVVPSRWVPRLPRHAVPAPVHPASTDPSATQESATPLTALSVDG